MSTKLIAAHDGSIIWGIGADEETAHQDAVYWAGIDYNDLQYSTMTERLATHVDRWGFDGLRDTFRVLPDGRLDFGVFRAGPRSAKTTP